MSRNLFVKTTDSADSRPYLEASDAAASGTASVAASELPPRGDRPSNHPTSPTLQRSLGVLATSALGIVLFAWALTVDLPKATGNGFFSDGATYYSLAYSLAEDGDFEYRREDLVRIWREFPAGPQGIFLKRGRDIQGVVRYGSVPFIHLDSVPDTDASRLYYGKSFIFPLAAAPFVRVFGTNGFLVLHALLMTACFACAYAFLSARDTPLSALVFAAAFLFTSVAPVYMVWLNPDFFNLAIVMIAYFFWAYKEVAGGPGLALPMSWVARLTTGLTSDLIAATLLGVATFSKPTYALLIAPLLGWHFWRRQWRHGAILGATFASVGVGLFGLNTAISGEWNYQGGEDRSTFYTIDPDGAGPRLGGFPFQSPAQTFDTTGLPKETNRVPVEVLTTGDALLQVFRRNLAYFLIGRHTGFIPYFFPGAVAVALFLVRPLKRPPWQWLTFGAGVGSALFVLLYMPFTYSGGGGPLGNRYFMGVYPVFLFLMPPLRGWTTSLIALGVGAFFTAQLTSNPFATSVRPGEHTKRGVFRLLPAELTLVDDLPVNLSPSRSKVPLVGSPPLIAYFIDDNAYSPANGWFWVRGESRTEVLLRTPVITTVTASGDLVRPVQLLRLEVQLETGAKPNRVTVSTGADQQTIDVPAHDQRSLTIPLPAGVPYKAFPELPINYVYSISIASETGFVPMFEGGSGDSRFLGINVRLVPQYDF